MISIFLHFLLILDFHCFGFGLFVLICFLNSPWPTSSSSGSSDTGSKNPASQHPAHSLISSLLFQTLVPLLRFPHLIRSTIASTFRLRFSQVRFFFFFFVKYFFDLYFFAFSFNFGFSLFWVWIVYLNLFLEFFVWITFIFVVFLLKAKKLMFLLFCVHSLRGKRWVHEAYLSVLCFNSLD